MNIEQLDLVKKGLTSLKSIKIHDVIKNYIGSKSLEQMIDVIQLKDIPYYFDRMISQFEQEIKNPDFAFYPESHSVDGEDSSLTYNMSVLEDYLLKYDINNAIIPLKRLVFYQIYNGFWNKGFDTSDNVINKKEIQKLRDEAELLVALSQNRYSESNTLLDKLLVKQKELEEFKISKNEELDKLAKRIESYIQTSQNANTEISSLLNNATRSDEQMNSALALIKSKQNEVNELLEKWNIDYKKFLSTYTSMNKKVDEYDEHTTISREQFQKLYEEVESKKSYFNDRNKYLDDLIGREVGASLFSTFNARKVELDVSVKRWRMFVIGAATIALFVIIVSYWISAVYEANLNEWQRISNSALKSIPALFLLYYTISQYNKERNFQEAYAFKSAVALTIMAYRDQLKDDDKKAEDFIIESVRNVYTSPVASTTKVETKDVSSILDLLKSIKDILPDKLK